MTKEHPFCLADGTPFNPEYFHFHDRGRLVTTEEKYAVSKALEALDKDAPHAIAAATRARVAGTAVGATAEEAAKRISADIERTYGISRRPMRLVLVANFYPDVAMSVLKGTGACVYFATVDYPVSDAMQETRCIDDWTMRNATEAQVGNPNRWKEYANRRALIQPRFQLLGVKQKRGGP